MPNLRQKNSSDVASHLSIWCLKCERAAIRGTRFCARHSAKLPDYQKDEQLSTYKFSIGERVVARYSTGLKTNGTVKDRVAGYAKGNAYNILPDGQTMHQLFFESELTKIPHESPRLTKESPYTIAIDAVDAEILKHEQHITEIRKKIASLNRARTTLTDLRRAEA